LLKKKIKKNTTDSSS